MKPDDAHDPDRQLLVGFISGAVTEEERPALLEDDVLLFAVARVDADDPAWVPALLDRPDALPGPRALLARFLEVRRTMRGS